jgi:hypothetical protein
MGMITQIIFILRNILHKYIYTEVNYIASDYYFLLFVYSNFAEKSLIYFLASNSLAILTIVILSSLKTDQNWMEFYNLHFFLFILFDNPCPSWNKIPPIYANLNNLLCEDCTPPRHCF